VGTVVSKGDEGENSSKGEGFIKMEKKDFFEKREMVLKIWEVQRMEEENNLEMLEEREVQKKVRWERIKKSRFNK